MAKTVLRLDKRRVLKDGTYPVQISVGYGTGLYLPTGIYVAEEHWSADARQCIGKDAKRLNGILAAQLARIQTRVYELRERGTWSSYTTAQLRQMLEDLTLERPTVGLVTLGEMFDRYSSAARSEARKATIKQTRDRLHRYCDTYAMQISDLGKSDARKLIAWLCEDVAPNTAKLYASTLRSVYNLALDTDVVTTDIFRGVKMPRGEDTATPIFSAQQIQAMRAARPKKSRTEEVRDLCLLSLYLRGINFADIIALTPSNIVGDRLEYRRRKTGRLYSIKIEPEAREILDKYPPRGGLLVGVRNPNPYLIRRHLSILVDEDGNNIAQGASWYWMRYTWASTASMLDISEDVISRGLGHKHSTGASVTRTYINFDHRKIDDANRRVLDYLLYGKK